MIQFLEHIKLSDTEPDHWSIEVMVACSGQQWLSRVSDGGLAQNILPESFKKLEMPGTEPSGMQMFYHDPIVLSSMDSRSR